MKIIKIILLITIIFSISLTHSFASQRIEVYIDKNSSEKIVLPAVFDVKIIGFPYIMDHNGDIIDFGKVLKLMLINNLKERNIYIDNKNIKNKYILLIEIVGYNFGNDVYKLDHILQQYFSMYGEAHKITNFSEMYIRTSICKMNSNIKNVIEKQLAIIPIKTRIENTSIKDDVKLTKHLSMGPYVKPAELKWSKLCYNLLSEIMHTLTVFLDCERD